MITAIFGGTFDPPHNGHVALLRGAEQSLQLDDLLVIVVADPGHRGVESPAEIRLALARAAFPGYQIELDEHARTVDLLRSRRLEDPVLLVGADELAAFQGWKEPEAVLELARLAVATRTGYRRDELDAVVARFERPERILFFEIEPIAISSTNVRRRVRAGQPVDELVPPAVLQEIERQGLYRETEKRR
jgi:nicotinate-nucleotide adenylyltransferase